MAGVSSARIGEPSLANLLGALRRRWRIIAVCAGAALMLAVMVTAVQKPVYSGTALVLVDWRQDRVLPSDTASEGHAVSPEILDSEIEMIRSRALLGRLVDAVAVQDRGKPKPPPRVSLADRLGLAGKPLSAPELRERAIDDLEEHIKIKRRRLSYIIEINATDSDPHRAAFLANTLADLYLDSQFESRLEAAGRANSWLAGRLQNLKEELASKEQAVETYRSDNGLITSAGSMLTDQQASGLQGELVAARADLAEKTARYHQVRDVLRNGGAVDTVAAVVNDATVMNLRRQEGELARKLAELEARFRDDYPAVKQARAELASVDAQIDRETQRIVYSIKNDMDASSARVAALASYASGVRNEIKSNNKTSVRLRELEREAAATRAVYEGFLQRANEVSQEETFRTGEVRLVARASAPNKPSSPLPARNAILGLMLGLAAGVGLAALRELLDISLTGSADDVERLLNYTVVGALPRVKARDWAGLETHSANPAGYLAARPMSAYAEGIQQLRASLDQALESAVGGRRDGGSQALDPKPRRKAARALQSLVPIMEETLPVLAGPARARVVAITSAVSGDGKTTTAVALARAYALAGRRVVLVECDLRRQSVVDHLERPPKAGLLHALTGAVDWRAALARDHATSACFLLAKAPAMVADATSFTLEDIFASRPMEALLDEIRSEFEVVILDCPPVLAATETRVLARIADGCILLVRWASTPRAAADSALKRLLGVGANVAGVALNGVEIGLAPYYYYDFSHQLNSRFGWKKRGPAPAPSPTDATWKSVISIIPERNLSRDG
jgi:uncharacterized protein involved in exopolysaccharide biosynthesis/Mrp family chromosome partitioning ATPase